MNKCEQTSRLNLLLDGELSETESRELIAHIQQCEICAAEWRELQSMQALWRKNAAPVMPEAAMARIHRSVDTAMGRQTFERVAHRLASLAALVVIAAGLWIIRPTATTTTTTTTATNTPAISLPDTWETAALKYTDDTNTSAEVGVATWIVADLSPRSGSSAR